MPWGMMVVLASHIENPNVRLARIAVRLHRQVHAPGQERELAGSWVVVDSEVVRPKHGVAVHVPLVDRRFYRQKYDAQQVLAQFAQTTRDEVETEALQAELVRVIQETMQPETIVIWVKPTEN